MFDDFQQELLSYEIIMDNQHSTMPLGNTSFAMYSNKKQKFLPGNHLHVDLFHLHLRELLVLPHMLLVLLDLSHNQLWFFI